MGALLETPPFLAAAVLVVVGGTALTYVSKYLILVQPRTVAVANSWRAGSEPRVLGPGVHLLGVRDELQRFGRRGATRLSTAPQLLDTPPQSLLLESGTLDVRIDLKVQYRIAPEDVLRFARSSGDAAETIVAALQSAILALQGEAFTDIVYNLDQHIERVIDSVKKQLKADGIRIEVRAPRGIDADLDR